MSAKPGDWVADREMLAEAAADPSLSDGAVRCLCLARVGAITDENLRWAKSISDNIAKGVAALSSSQGRVE